MFGARRGRLHGDQRERLQDVVLDDVAQGADGVVEAAAVVDSEVLRHRDLDRLDVAAVPDRLEYGVGEAQVGDVLHRLLAEEVVDSVDLILVKDLVDLVVEFDRRLEVVSERFLDHHPGALRQTRAAEALDHSGEERGRDLKVKDRVLRRGERLLQPLVGGLVHVVPLHVTQTVGELLEYVLVDPAPLSRLDPGLDGLARVLPQVIVAPIGAPDADHGHLERAVLAQVVQGLQSHLLRQVAGDPEDHQGIAVSAGRRA